MVPIGQSSTGSNGACRPKQAGRQALPQPWGVRGRCARCYAAAVSRGSAGRRHATGGIEAMVQCVVAGTEAVVGSGGGQARADGFRGRRSLLVQGLGGRLSFGFQCQGPRVSVSYCWGENVRVPSVLAIGGSSVLLTPSHCLVAGCSLSGLGVPVCPSGYSSGPRDRRVFAFRGRPPRYSSGPRDRRVFASGDFRERDPAGTRHRVQRHHLVFRCLEPSGSRVSGRLLRQGLWGRLAFGLPGASPRCSPGA